MAVLKTQFTLKLESETHVKIRKIAQMESRSMTNMIESILKKEIKEYEEKNGKIEVTEEELWEE